MRKWFRVFAATLLFAIPAFAQRNAVANNNGAAAARGSFQPRGAQSGNRQGQQAPVVRPGVNQQRGNPRFGFNNNPNRNNPNRNPDPVRGNSNLKNRAGLGVAPRANTGSRNNSANNFTANSGSHSNHAGLGRHEGGGWNHHRGIWWGGGWYFGGWYGPGWYDALLIYPGFWYRTGWIGYQYNYEPYPAQSGIKFDLGQIPGEDHKKVSEAGVYLPGKNGEKAYRGTVGNFSGRLHKSLPLGPGTYEITVSLADGRQIDMNVMVQAERVTKVSLRLDQVSEDEQEAVQSPAPTQPKNN